MVWISTHFRTALLISNIHRDSFIDALKTDVSGSDLHLSYEKATFHK